MLNKQKIHITQWLVILKAVMVCIILIMLFSTCKKANISNNKVTNSDSTDTSKNTGPAKDSSSIPASITVVSGDNQIGIRGVLLYSPPTVLVKNKAGIPLSGIPVRFTPCPGCGTVNWVYFIGCAGCTPIPVDTIQYTNADGRASTNWLLGTLSDSNQSLTAKVQDTGLNLSATLHVTTKYYQLHNFIGTIYIIATGDTSGPPAPFILPYGGVTPFKSNTNMPFEMDSMSLDVENYIVSPKIIIMNGDTIFSSLSHDSLTAVGCCSFPGGINDTSGGTFRNYIFNWTFTGTVTNRVFSGTYQNATEYFITPPPPSGVLRGGYSFGGSFSVTQQ